jgi:hypothetical protein
MGLLAKSSKSLFPKAYEYFSEEQYPFNDLFFVFSFRKEYSHEGFSISYHHTVISNTGPFAICVGRPAMAF